MRRFNFEEGLEFCLSALKTAQEQRPNFVAVFGSPDSGKSTFIHRLWTKLEEVNITATTNGCSDGESYFEAILHPRCNWAGKDVYLIHCCYDIADQTSDDPNKIVPKIFEKRVLLNVGIFNPKFRPEPQGEYDLLISNSESTRKYPY